MLNTKVPCKSKHLLYDFQYYYSNVIGCLSLLKIQVDGP